jgi:hypothetical protein
VKGKLETAIGKIEDRAHDAGVEADEQHDPRP